jgi:hypothetical protein
MTNRDLLKEAIADAKAVKEVAIANAKAALEETFAPHLENMFKKQMSELDVTEESTVEESDFNLEELLRELEEEQLEETSTHGHESEEEKSLEEAENAEEESKESEETSEEHEDVEFDLNLEDMTPETKRKLEAFIGQVFDELVEKGEVELPNQETPTEEEPAEEPSEETSEEGEETDSFEEKNKEEMMSEYRKRQEMTARKELSEAYRKIKTLNEELTEVNLLNAKLLYTNKIFKAKNLTENQKVQVLSAFDKADTVKEAKLVYETLKENLTKTEAKKTFIQESKSYASKSVGISPKQPVVDVNPVFERMKKLAGL